MIRKKENITIFYLIAILAGIVVMGLPGCSGRKKIPVFDQDSTLVYPAKKADDISARITLCRKFNKKTGKPVDAGAVFSIGEKEMVRAYIELQNKSLHADKDLMFHLEWIGPDKSCFYMKRIDLLPGDTADFLYSSVSVAPGTREPGAYQLKLYYFRQLIGVKEFMLVSDSVVKHSLAGNIASGVRLYRITGKKSAGQPQSDTVFETGEKAKLRAVFDIKNNGLTSSQAQTFLFEWVDAEGQSFYRKQVDLLPGDTAQSISSAISLSTESRQPGKYAIRIFLSDYLLNEQTFELIAEKKAPKPELGHVDVRIMLGTSLDKKTGVLKNQDTIFAIGEKAKIFALAEIKNRSSVVKETVEFLFEWVDSKGKSFYSKQIDFGPSDEASFLSSGISIPPSTRVPGNYSVRLYVFDELIAEKKFQLKNEVKSNAPKVSNVSASLALCKNYDNKTGEKAGEDSVFIIKDKARIFAVAELIKRPAESDQNIEFVFDWIDPEGKSFFRKQVDLMPGDTLKTISSSVSITPDKRQPGNYQVKLYLFDQLLSEGKFLLKPE